MSLEPGIKPAGFIARRALARLPAAICLRTLALVSTKVGEAEIKIPQVPGKHSPTVVPTPRDGTCQPELGYSSGVVVACRF